MAVHVELQDIGSKLPDIGARWEGVIRAARELFSGKMTASVNGGPGISAEDAKRQTYWPRKG